MAGQLTLTYGPVRQGDLAWIMRAMISFPVPLSPPISTGTLALATLSKRSRKAFICSDLPKITSSGGISPSDCTSEPTGLDVDIGIDPLMTLYGMIGAPRKPNSRRPVRTLG